MIKLFGLFAMSIIVGLAFVAPQSSTSLQEQACERIVKSALDTTHEICSLAGRNEACYGHDMLEAEPQSRQSAFTFEKAGDIIDVSLIKKLRLSSMDVSTGNWGVALMNLQANLPDEETTQNVTLLLFGDVQINNLITPRSDVEIFPRTAANINIRRLPSDEAFVIGTLNPDQPVTARGRSEDGNWILIDIPETDQTGWVFTTLMNVPGGVENLSIIEPGLIEYGPMQAFYVRTGNNTSACAEAPNDGLLIQTPEGVGEVRLWINEVKIRLGSTVFITAQENNQMTISTLEGHAAVEAQGVEYTAVEGTTVSIPMNRNLRPSAPPRPPKPYSKTNVEDLPVENLEEPVDPAPPQETPQILATLATPVTVTATEEPTLIPTEVVPTATDTIEPSQEPSSTPNPTDEPTVTATQPLPTATSTEAPPLPTATNTEAPPPATATEESGGSSSESSSSTEEPALPPTEESTETPEP